MYSEKQQMLDQRLELYIYSILQQRVILYK